MRFRSYRSKKQVVSALGDMNGTKMNDDTFQKRVDLRVCSVTVGFHVFEGINPYGQPFVYLNEFWGDMPAQRKYMNAVKEKLGCLLE